MEISLKCLFFRFSVPKVRKSANNETKMFFIYFEHDFMFASTKSDPLMGILGNEIFLLELEL